MTKKLSARELNTTLNQWQSWKRNPYLLSPTLPGCFHSLLRTKQTKQSRSSQLIPQPVTKTMLHVRLWGHKEELVKGLTPKGLLSLWDKTRLAVEWALNNMQRISFYKYSPLTYHKLRSWLLEFSKHKIHPPHRKDYSQLSQILFGFFVPHSDMRTGNKRMITSRWRTD